MLNRKVMIEGDIFEEHRLMELDCFVGQRTIARVDSMYADGSALGTFHEIPYEDGMTVERAEALTWALPFFDEYVDDSELLGEVLEILTDDQAATVPDAFPKWKPDTEYKVGDRRRHGDVLYKCLQAHTSQEGQTPDVAVSLWARILNPDPEVIPVWEQPDSTNAYMTGDKVHYPDAEGPIYESVIDNNIWSPEAYPQGWQIVEGGE